MLNVGYQLFTMKPNSVELRDEGLENELNQYEKWENAEKQGKKIRFLEAC